MTILRESAPILEDRATKPVLEILAVSDHEWRVCDGRLSQTDARRMLGFIGKTRGVYELIHLQGDPRLECFDSLTDALGALLDPTDDGR